MNMDLGRNHRRKRVSKACDRCRRQRNKCDGLRPTCSTCQKASQACLYDPNVKKRGLPKGYVRRLENLFALSLRNNDSFEEAVLDMLGAAESLKWLGDTADETLHGLWKTSRLFSKVKELLHIPDAPLASAHRKVLPNLLGILESQPMGVAATSLISGVPQARVPQDIGYQNIAQIASSIYTRQIPPQMLQLLETYFAVAHPWFPIVVKHKVLHVSYLIVNTSTPIVAASPDSGDHAVLWAIFSYTVTHSLTSPLGGDAEMLSLAKEYHDVSLSLIPSEKEHYDLGYVQALLLLTLVNVGLEDWTAARVLIDRAARMAIAMGLGTPSSTPRFTEPGSETTVFLACFVIDSLLSFRLSHIPSMLPIDLAAVSLLEEDELKDSSSCVDGPLFRGIAYNENLSYRRSLSASSCFNRLVELALVLNKISRDVWTKFQPADLAQQFLMELKGWDECLPHECTPNESENIFSDQHMDLLPYQSYVCLTHIATLLWLYLRLIPGEQGLHPLQWPAMDGALRLLSQSLTIISQQLADFPFWDLPPMFEVVLRTIVEQALMLRHAVEPLDVFPFDWWLNELRQKIVAISPTWPAYITLASAMERLQKPQ